MTATKWWDLAFSAAVVALGLIASFSFPDVMAATWGVWATLAALVLCYFAFGRLAFARPRVALAFMIVLALGAGVLTSFQPAMATFQAIALPLIWHLSASIRQAILVNLLLTSSVGVGFVISLGGSADAVTQAVVTEALSLAFSIALGLWITRIADYGQERARLLDELTAVQSELATANHDAGVASERERLSREIHDTIAQSLTSLVLLAQRARGELGRAGEGADGALETVELIEGTAREALTEARSLVAALAPLPVGDSSLAEVVARLAARFTRETDVKVTASVTVADVPRELEVVLLRCAQEGLANVRKHARASQARVSLERVGDDLRLEVRDDGRGLVEYTPSADNGFGLSGMRDRVALVGGRLEVTGSPGEGTSLVVTVPAPVSEAARAETPAGGTVALGTMGAA
ncbi:sensor histidine kinase [Microbacterium sp. STN6]|uniref:sensor histidine kinase n=1 Tax=Microbacterium sp. STN6 TaxID=2995588 RepID=UPI002260FFB4|nr:sensor histidine kinase [Microbacterium sp. STN6]MCX7520738.1 sensor histidine kinase [Microbacterium sp. STN6]